jgi:hypothetical protein
MTDKEVMKQALEALIDAANVLSAPMFSDAATALRTTLEQPEQEPVAWTTMPETTDWDFVSGSKDPTGKLEGKWFPLYATPPAAHTSADTKNTPPPEWPLIKNILAEYGLQAIAFVAEWKAAQRPWQGLTDEEITEIYEMGLGVRASIETALDKIEERNT